MHHPQSGAVGALVGNMWKGANAYLQSVNDNGGIHGRTITLVRADDQYSSQGAASAIRELVDRRGVFAVACPAGVDQCVVGGDYANSKGVPYIHGGMSESFVQERSWLFPVTPSYPYAGERMVDYLFQEGGFTRSRKIAGLYLASENLAETVPRIESALSRYGSRLVVKAPVEKDQLDFSAAITKMQNEDVDTVWFNVDPTILAKFTAQARSRLFFPQYVFAYPQGGQLYADTTGGALDGAVGVAGIADPDWEGAKEFRTLMERYHPEQDNPDEFMLLAFVIAKVFVEGLKQAGPELGRDSFARGMQAIERFDTGVASPLSYAQRSRVESANSQMSVWVHRGREVVQIRGFDF